MTRSLSETLHGGSPDQWALDFLATARFPSSPANVQVVVSWEYAESAGGGGMWNPLNTTQGGYPGETNFNSVGVKNYVLREHGLLANAKVIHNGYYPAVVALLEQATNARAIADAIQRSPWGTGYITLTGTPQPQPHPQPSPEVPEMQTVVLPGPGRPAGRDPIALWDPGHPNRVTLENGARLEGDYSTRIPNVRLWTPRKADGSSEIPAGVKGISLAARLHDGIVVGVVLTCTGGNTYRGNIA